jgi:hypothetical protein
VESSSSSQLSDTADLLEALRKKRNEREQTEEESDVPHTDFLSVVPDIEEPEEIIEAVQPDPMTSTEATPPPKKGRASIPSWDEIVFGTKTED